MKHRTGFIAILFGLVLTLSGTAAAGPIQTCASSFAYNCAQPTLGGYYVLTPFPATGSTEITGYTSGGSQAFDITIPSPPNGPGSSALASEISYAQTQVAIQSGNLTPAQAFSLGGAGGQGFFSSLLLENYVARDTLETQNVTQYSTSINIDLNGITISSQTFSGAFGSPAVQSAILAGDSLLSFAGASPGIPMLIASSSILTGSQTDYLETGSGELASNLPNVASTSTFGPEFLVVNCFLLGSNPAPAGTCQDPNVQFVPLYVAPGVLDIQTVTTSDVFLDRTVTTTNDYLLTEVYEIDGFTITATPEPASFLLTGAGLAGLVMAALRKRRI